jgi:cobalt-zinc-cadmium efflux system outer membrane protein
VRQAYADVVLAQARLGVAREAVRIRGEIARFAEARLKAGDVSAQEAATTRIDALVAQEDAVRIAYDVAQAEERLRNLLALGDQRVPLALRPAPPPLRSDLDAEALTAYAVATRPDALAAEEAAAAAAERVRLARLGWFRFLLIEDATSGRAKGHELGPAFRVTVPIFNWNQGAVTRAEAERERLERQRWTVRNQIILDVHLAHLRYTQALADLQVLDRQVRPEIEAAIRRAESAYREGNTPYVVVLETTRQFLDTRLRREVLQADLRRAWAELERSVGRRLDPAEGTAAPAPCDGPAPVAKEPAP